MKRIPSPHVAPALKDESGAYVKVTPPKPEPVVTDISLDDIQERQLLILHREVKRLTEKSSEGLLTKDEGIAFERCVKILREFKKEEREMLDGLEDEDLDNIE